MNIMNNSLLKESSFKCSRRPFTGSIFNLLVEKYVQKSNKQVQKLVTPLQTQNSVSNGSLQSDVVRNIGVIAHVDAGKTTTTERMLYISGIIEELGSVDRGTTVTDFLEQERQKGITIQSAAVSFMWKNHTITLIDTPGHIDFTYEVERSLHAVDGTLAILDGSAGVEAQTETVWRQANKYNLQRLIFLNKMDKPAAELSSNLDSIERQLHVSPLLLQYPIGRGKEFKGLVDLITLTTMLWNQDIASRTYAAESLINDGSDLYKSCMEQRHNLIDTLAEHDECLMEEVMTAPSYDTITPDAIRDSLQKAVLNQVGVPVLLGSSLKNIGVQPLLDAIPQYLPPPANYNKVLSGKDIFGMAFKTAHDKDRGLITYLRLYNGTLKPSTPVHNASKFHNERIGKLFMVEANQLIEVKSSIPGSIVAVTGLTQTSSGDILTSDGSLYNKLIESKEITVHELSVPDPVFMCSIEPYSTSQQKALDEALGVMSKDDPSLRVKYDADTSQLVLYGMGELHLEIVKDRLLKEYNLEVYMGSVVVAYRESIQETSKFIIHELEETVDSRSHHILVELQVFPTSSSSKTVEFLRSPQQDWSRLSWRHRKAINLGLQSAFSSGPQQGCQVNNVGVRLRDFQILSRGTTQALISAAVYQAIHKALTSTKIIILEPVMKLSLKLPSEDNVNLVLKDLASRRAVVQNVVAQDDVCMIEARSPVETLVGYATFIRKATSGKAMMTMEIDGYQNASTGEEMKVTD